MPRLWPVRRRCAGTNRPGAGRDRRRACRVPGPPGGGRCHGASSAAPSAGWNRQRAGPSRWPAGKLSASLRSQARRPDGPAVAGLPRRMARRRRSGCRNGRPGPRAVPTPGAGPQPLARWAGIARGSPRQAHRGGEAGSVTAATRPFPRGAANETVKTAAAAGPGRRAAHHPGGPQRSPKVQPSSHSPAQLDPRTPRLRRGSAGPRVAPNAQSRPPGPPPGRGNAPALSTEPPEAARPAAPMPASAPPETPERVKVRQFPPVERGPRQVVALRRPRRRAGAREL